MGRLCPLRAPGETLFFRLAALMMFFARRRWLALESMLVPVGDMQRLGTGEEAADLCKGLVKGRLLWERAGDWHLELQGEKGEVPVGLDGLDVDTAWFIIGDWLLDPQGGDTGEVWAGFKIERAAGGLWLPTGDLLLVAHGGDTGEVAVCEGLGVKAELMVDVCI